MLLVAGTVPLGEHGRFSTSGKLGPPSVFSHHLLDHAPAAVREEAPEVLCAAARISWWRRNQPCWPSVCGSTPAQLVGCVHYGLVLITLSLRRGEIRERRGAWQKLIS